MAKLKRKSVPGVRILDVLVFTLVISKGGHLSNSLRGNGKYHPCAYGIHTITQYLSVRYLNDSNWIPLYFSIVNWIPLYFSIIS